MFLTENKYVSEERWVLFVFSHTVDMVISNYYFDLEEIPCLPLFGNHTRPESEGHM